VDRLPAPLPAGSQAAACLQKGRGVVALTDVALGPLTGGQFFPGAGIAVDENAPQVLGQDGGRVTLSFATQPKSGDKAERLTGVLWLQDNARSHAYQVDVPVQAARLVAATPQATTPGLHPAMATAALTKSPPPLWHVVLLAFAGGMLLNLMPCVFPILSMKAMALMQTSGAERRARQQHAWLYACGNFFTFTGLGIALLTLRYFGHQVGWGFQMQSPAFVAGLVLLMFSVGLAQMGWLRVGGSLMGLGQTYAEGRGHAAAFFTGVLAVVVATPCSAPFMGVATGAALAATAPTAVAIFAAMGLGLGLPYVALCHVQAAQRLLPRPGPWMQHLRQATGLALWGTTTWLMWILGQQRGLTAVLGAQLGCLALGAATWAWHTWPASRGARATGAILAVLGLTITFTASESVVPQRSTQEARWRPYSAEGLEALRNAGRPVFVDFTAAWCVTCQLNAKLILETTAVEAAFQAHDVARLRADWTDEDPEISAALASFGRSGVPLYVLYPANPAAPPVVLPGLLTAGSIYAALAHQPAPLKVGDYRP
jgi:thiol:disulfide interchange protein DsbD